MHVNKGFAAFWNWLITSQYLIGFPLFLITRAGSEPNKFYGIVPTDASSVPAIGLPFDLAIATACLLFTRYYARTKAGSPWQERTPLLHLPESIFDAPGKRRNAEKIGIFLVAHVLPALAIAQMSHLYFVGAAFDHNGLPGALPVHGPGFGFLSWPDPMPSQMRFGHANGLSHFAWCPFLYLVVGLGYCWLLGSTTRAVFGARAPLPATSVAAAAATPGTVPPPPPPPPPAPAPAAVGAIPPETR